jgi:hypothetical protein
MAFAVTGSRRAFTACLVGVLLCAAGSSAPGAEEDAVASALVRHQYHLGSDGRAFLLSAADRATFFMLGETHGDEQVPALLRDIWSELWRRGYRHVAAELSPWRAEALGREGGGAAPELGLWTPADAAFVRSVGGGAPTVLWGCDMEETQVDLLVREWARANPRNRALQELVARLARGYERTMARDLLGHLADVGEVADPVVGGVSLRDSITRTLEIEVDRLLPETRRSASIRREQLMKELFLAHYRSEPEARRGKVLARFGRNHLHRGIDRRGVSTLGNFLTELAHGEGRESLHLAVFAAGGRVSLGGETADADERGDDPAFARLAAAARHPATVFDLRPLRAILRRTPVHERSAEQSSLVYWADSYDAILCLRAVTPLRRPGAVP